MKETYSCNGLGKTLGYFHLSLETTPETYVKMQHKGLKTLEVSRIGIAKFELETKYQGELSHL